MYAGDVKDGAYRELFLESMANDKYQEALEQAQQIGKSSVNFNGEGEVGNRLDAYMFPSRIDRVRRSLKWGDEHRRAIDVQHERLDHVAECHGGALSDAAVKAKASTLPIVVRNMLTGFEIFRGSGRCR